MTPDESTQTIAFLANELRRAMESVTALHQVATQQKAELDKLKAPTAVAAPTEGEQH